jgi:hypothetical protein
MGIFELKEKQPRQGDPSMRARSKAQALARTQASESIRAQSGKSQGNPDDSPTYFARDFSRMPVHAGPLVSSPGDRFEHEAERRADEALHRTGARSMENPGPAGSQSPLAGLLPGSGRALPQELRDYFEPRFGHDFSRVRVHSDGTAARSARALGARAYTSGEDVVLAEGQYAPQTGEGRRLLAHELAHVAQQRAGGAGPLIRPRLFVSGAAPDLKAFFDLLEPASGYTLKRDPKTGQVTAVSAKDRPPSIVLAAELMTILEDPQQDAEINVGRTQTGTRFGAFPSKVPEQTPPKSGREGLVQEVRIDQMAALEKGAPGAGATKLAHEMLENFHAHSPEVIKQFRANTVKYPDAMWGGVFDESHREAIEKENLIAAELGHPGGRQNTFGVPMGRPPREFTRWIEDHEQYFLVWDSTGGVVSNSRRVARARVSSFIIPGFQPGSDRIPEAGRKIIDQVAADMQKNPTVSARVEGLLSVFDSPRGDAYPAESWAGMVKDELITKLTSISPTGTQVWERFYKLGSLSREKSSVVITLDRPDM